MPGILQKSHHAWIVSVKCFWEWTGWLKTTMGCSLFIGQKMIQTMNIMVSGLFIWHLTWGRITVPERDQRRIGEMSRLSDGIIAHITKVIMAKIGLATIITLATYINKNWWNLVAPPCSQTNIMILMLLDIISICISVKLMEWDLISSTTTDLPTGVLPTGTLKV